MPAINNTDIKLMLAMIASAEALKTDNDKLAALIGDGSTSNAIRQRVQKIKTLAKAVLAGEDVDITSAGAKSKSATPVKRKATNNDGGENQTSPSKKRSPKKTSTSGSKGHNEQDIKEEAEEELAESGKCDGVDNDTHAEIEI